MTPEEKRTRIVHGLHACLRAGIQTGPMLALNKYMVGDHQTVGVAGGVEATADRLLELGFDPPADANTFSAALACNLLGSGAGL